MQADQRARCVHRGGEGNGESLSLHPSAFPPVPAEKAHVAQAAFPKGNRSLQMRDVLGTLAHTLLMWVRRWLAQSSPQHACRLQQYGIKRMVRDVAYISGSLTYDKHRRLQRIALSSASSLTKRMLVPLRHLLAPPLS